tara:strand:- start:959 stop:1498 length:540 start_codon:yes stop_codon:yes gene_type:complete
MIINCDNFFDHLENLQDVFKKIPLYTAKEIKEKPDHEDEYWPGKRSEFLERTEFTKPLFFLFLKEFNHKLGYVFQDKRYTLKLSIHLRLEEDDKKDWIHRDDDGGKGADYSMIVNLSKTNLNSGTAFYDNDNNEILNSKFVQNRALLFKSDILHKGFGHHGKDMNDGRLTMNGFFKFIK